MEILADFFVLRHDPVIVALAALSCLLSAYACISLVRHARQSGGMWRWIWSAVAALAVGLGIWSTHFIAMLGFRPGFDLAFDVGITALSLAIAVAICGLGMVVAVGGGKQRDFVLGGAIVGIGISSMHFTGMAAIEMGGAVVWDGRLVAISVLMGMLAGGAGLAVGSAGTWPRLLGGAALLTVAVCTMHFTAMAAAGFDNCFALVGDEQVLSPALLSVGVAAVTGVVLVAVLVSVALDNADRRRSEREDRRARDDRERIAEIGRRLDVALTHAGQAVCLYDSSGKVVVHNARLPELVGLPAQADLTGWTMLDISRAAVRAAGISDETAIERRAEEAVRTHMALARRPGGGEIVHEAPGGRILRLAHSPLDDGSWVTTIDDITERQQSQAKIAHLSRHDELTGLPNRGQFVDVLEMSVSLADKGGRQVVVATIDLDGFNDINDRYGLELGDQVMKALADRLLGGTQLGELVARLGGDEFAAIKSVANVEEVHEWLDRLQRLVSGTIVVSGKAIPMSASIGVALYPDDAVDAQKLMANAEIALGRAKSDPLARVCHYDAALDQLARARRDLTAAVGVALAHHEFHPVYQVQKSLSTGEVSGYEVLLRWQHPTRGLVPPAEFIPVAEESGAISAIGRWVLETACRQAVAKGLRHRIAVNLSPLQLAEDDLPEAVANILDRTGLAPERLELEVTESAIIADKARALLSLRAFKAMGIAIALDDFGTGYSSLDTLRSFPFDKIKLDQAFATELGVDEQALAILRAVLALGRSLRIPVLAEGIETEEQLKILRREGCDEAQGYLLGRPVPISDLEAPGRLALAS